MNTGAYWCLVVMALCFLVLAVISSPIWAQLINVLIASFCGLMAIKLVDVDE